jgi:dsRNA-specific ribonuclease
MSKINSPFSSQEIGDLLDLEDAIGYRFSNRDYLVRCCTHRSYSNEHSQAPHNEVLELLGDSVLELFVRDALIEAYSEESEGHITKLKSIIVRDSQWAKIVAKAGLGRFLRLGVGERMQHREGQQRSAEARATAHGGFFESIFGAVFLDAKDSDPSLPKTKRISKGYEAAAEVFMRLVPNILDLCNSDTQEAALDKDKDKDKGKNWKDIVQRYVQGTFRGNEPPKYLEVGRVGTDHNPGFIVCLSIPDEDGVLQDFVAAAPGKRRNAEMEAAKKAVQELPIRGYD